METKTLTIDGMSCGHCVTAVANALQAVHGIRVNDVAVGRADVSYERDSTALEDATQAIERAGYTVVPAIR